jgi:hypothetical protein
MQVRLTKEGQKALGFSPDRKIANVSDDRAFVLMTRGFAAQDKGFMSLFDGEVPEKPESKPEPKLKILSAEDRQKMIDKMVPAEPEEKAVKPKPPKKEKAVSIKAKKRKKAVKK